MLLSLLALLVAAETTAPDLISIEVGLVRVTPFRPGTQTPWAIPGRPSQKDPCGLLVAVATTAVATSSLGLGVGTAPVIQSLCSSMMDTSTATQTHIDSDPNVYVR